MFRKQKEESKEVIFPDVIISLAEYNRRKAIWEEYYSKTKSSKAYSRLILQREALKEGDMATVKFLAEEARKEIENGESCGVPSFPDPEIEKQYKRLGVKEWLEVTVRKDEFQALQARLAFDN